MSLVLEEEVYWVLILLPQEVMGGLVIELLQVHSQMEALVVQVMRC